MDIDGLKIENAILFFANHSSGGTIDRLKLMKLLWLSDRLHLLKYGKLILKDRYSALPHGPVPSCAKDLSDKGVENSINVQGFNIEAVKEFNEDFFSKSNLDVMKYVVKNYLQMGSFDLRNYSHTFPEWIRFENDLNNPLTPNSYEMVIHDFFDLPEDNCFNDYLSKEEIEMSKHEFNVNNSINSFFK